MGDEEEYFLEHCEEDWLRTSGWSNFFSSVCFKIVLKLGKYQNTDIEIGKSE